MAQYSDAWCEEDYTDFSRAGWELINARLGDEEDADMNAIMVVNFARPTCSMIVLADAEEGQT